jgi:predicted nucleotidyltransferase component of viral defense system
MAYDKFPLRNLLKGKELRIAELQDALMTEVSAKFDAILHGGTAIWRIYGGKRFSFDLDFYYKDPAGMLAHFEKAAVLRPVRSKMTGSDVCYMRFEAGGASAEINVSPIFAARGKHAVDGEFRLVGGDSIIVRTLSETELLREKIAAYSDRRKARDIYDIFLLLDAADTAQVKSELHSLVPLMKEPPADFSGLRELILLGKSPDFETMARKVQAYAKG